MYNPACRLFKPKLCVTTAKMDLRVPGPLYVFPLPTVATLNTCFFRTTRAQALNPNSVLTAELGDGTSPGRGPLRAKGMWSTLVLCPLKTAWDFLCPWPHLGPQAAIPTLGLNPLWRPVCFPWFRPALALWPLPGNEVSPSIYCVQAPGQSFKCL